MAADVILSPIKPDVLSAAEFADGTLRMMESLNSLSDFGADFRSGHLYVVISALERNNNARHVADQIRRSFPRSSAGEGNSGDGCAACSRLYRRDNCTNSGSSIRPSQRWQIALGRHASPGLGTLPRIEPHLRGPSSLRALATLARARGRIYTYASDSGSACRRGPLGWKF